MPSESEDISEFFNSRFCQKWEGGAKAGSSIAVIQCKFLPFCPCVTRSHVQVWKGWKLMVRHCLPHFDKWHLVAIFELFSPLKGFLKPVHEIDVELKLEGKLNWKPSSSTSWVEGSAISLSFLPCTVSIPACCPRKLFGLATYFLLFQWQGREFKLQAGRFRLSARKIFWTSWVEPIPRFKQKLDHPSEIFVCGFLHQRGREGGDFKECHCSTPMNDGTLFIPFLLLFFPLVLCLFRF